MSRISSGPLNRLKSKFNINRSSDPDNTMAEDGALNDIHQANERIKDLEKQYDLLEFERAYEQKIYKSIIKNNERQNLKSFSSLTQKSDLIRQSISEIRNTISNMNHGSMQISESTAMLSKITLKQSEFAQKVFNSVDTLKSNNGETTNWFNTLNQGIGELEKQSSQLLELVAAVHDIADQLNMLSLNGSIEAARTSAAGSEGKGFAVVAQETQKLAIQVTELSKDQTGRINTIVGRIKSITEQSSHVNDLLENNNLSAVEATSYVHELNEELSSIASSSEELSATSEEFSASVEELDASIELISREINSYYVSLQRSMELSHQTTLINDAFTDIASRSATMHEAAQESMIWLRENILYQNEEFIIMARLFITLPYKTLHPLWKNGLKTEEYNPDDRFLCLIGTSGKNSLWNKVENSVNHLIIPLPSDRKKLDEKIPMLSAMFDSMEIPYERILHPNEKSIETIEGYMLTEEAMSSPNIPAKDFIKDYNIISQLGLGGVFSTGNIFACFLFTNNELDDDFAETMKILPMSIQQIFNNFDREELYI
jgi:methyl-accepting chemotaxis protein